MVYSIEERRRRARALMDERRKRMEEQAKQQQSKPAAAPSVQKKASPAVQAPKPRPVQNAVSGPSLADNLWFHGVNILKTDDPNYIADERKPATKKKGAQQERPMLRKLDLEYLRDPKTGKLKAEDSITLTDIYRALRQVPANERQVVTELFEQNYLKRRSSPYRDIYYSNRSNNTAAMKLWGTEDLTSIVTNPDNLKYLDYIVPNKNGQTPKAPTKRSSLNEQKAYSMYHLLQDHKDELSAKAEMPMLYTELGELAKSYPDKSEQEILEMFDWDTVDENGNKAFKTIAAYRKYAADYMEKHTVGGGLYVGDESLKAVIRAARRGEDVSEVKDYIKQGADSDLWQSMTEQAEARKPISDKSADKEPSGGIVGWIGRKYNETATNAARIGKGVQRIAGEAFDAAAPHISGALRGMSIFPAPTQEQIREREQRRLETALNQSVQTTGKIDLRDPSIPEDRWDFLVEANLASAEQRDALIAQRTAEQSTPEYTGMTPGAFDAQSSGVDRSDMTIKELAEYDELLSNQLALLDQYGQSSQASFEATAQEIQRLESEIQNSDEPVEADDPRFRQLQALYQQQRDMFDGKYENQPERDAARNRIQAERDSIREGIASLRGESIRAVKQARQEQAESAPKETQEHRALRLFTADIDALAGEVAYLETDVKNAQEQYHQNAETLNMLTGGLGGIGAVDMSLEPNPAYVEAQKEINRLKGEQNALDLAFPDINLEGSSDLNTRIMRKKQEVLEAARLQYDALPVFAIDFNDYASRGLALKNDVKVGKVALLGDLKIEGIGNPATFAMDNTVAVLDWVGAVEGGGQVPTSVQNLFDMTFMSESEVQTYSYLLAHPKYGPEKATLYFESLRDELRYRHGAQIARPMLGNPWASVPFGFAVGADQHVQGLAQAFHPNEIMPTTALQYAGWNLDKGLQEIGAAFPDWIGGGSISQKAYRLSSAFGGMMPTALMNAFVPGSGIYELWVSAGGNSYRDSMLSGHTQDEAARYGLVRGAMEAYLEGGLGMLATGGGKLTSALFGKMTNAMRGPVADFMLRIGMSAASNGTEEYLQDVLDPWAQALAYGEEFKELDFSDPQAIESGLIGALMGVLGDSPAVASQIFGTKAVGVDFNNPEAVRGLIEAGLYAPESSKAYKDADAAAARIEAGKDLGDYRAGKLAESVGPELMDMAAQMADENAPMNAAGNQAITAPAIAAPLDTTIPDIDLSAEIVSEINGNARRTAYEVSRDVKSYAPPMARMVVRAEAIEARMNDVLKTQLTASMKANDLTRENGKILLQVASGEIDNDAGLKQIQKNVQGISEARSQAEAAKAEHSRVSDEFYEARKELSKAQGEVYQATFQAELNAGLAEAKRQTFQRMEAERAAAETARAQEEALAANAARVEEIAQRVQEIDSTDAQLATSEEHARRGAQQALDAENAALNAIGTTPGAAQQAEQASVNARAAYDRLQSVQNQRQNLRQQRVQLEQERAALDAKAQPKNEAGRAMQNRPEDVPDMQTSAATVSAQQDAANVEKNQAAQAQQRALDEVPEPNVTTAKKQAPTAPVDMEMPIDKTKRLLKTRFPHAQVDPKTLKVDPDAYQFRSGADKSGVTKPMQGDYSPLYSDDIVVHERMNGDMYVADGHHRTEFAVRKGIDAVDVIVLRESDGVSVEDARMLAAARNMSQNHGEPVDAAKIFRDLAIKAEDLAELGLTVTNSVIEKGFALAQLTNEYWKRVVSGNIDEFTGYVMGKYFPLNEKMQAAFMQFMGQRGGKNLSNAAKEELANILDKAEKVDDPDKQYAFDFFDNFDSNALQVAELAARIKGKLARAHGLFKSLSNENKQAIIEAVGQNRIDADANDAKAGNISVATALMENYATGGKVHDIINRLATDIAEKRITLEKAAEQAKDEIIKLAQKGGLVIGGIDTQGSVPTVKGNRPADSRTEGSRAEGKGTVKQTPATADQAGGTETSLMQSGAAASSYPAPATTRNQTPQRVSKTAKDLYRAMGVRHTSKHKPAALQKMAQGLYEHHSGVVVTKTHQDVNVFAHELGHAIFERAKVFDRQGNPSPAFKVDIDAMVNALAPSFKALYQPNELGREAAAYFTNLYLLNRDGAVNFAGQDFVNQFESELLSKNQLRAMAKACNQFNLALTAELVDNYRARIDYSGKQEVARGAEGAWGRFIQGFADRYYSVELFDIAANKLGYDNADPARRAYIAFSNIPYSVTQAANIVEQNLSTPNGTVIGESFKDIMRGIARESMEDWNTYITALHDIDRQAQGKPVFGDYTAQTSETVAQTLEQAHPEFRQAHQNLMNWWNAFIDEWVVNTNAIENAAEKIAHFRELYPNYVPTFRSMNDQVDVMTEEFGDMGGMLGQASVHFKRAKGGDQAIKSPIASMVARVGEIVTATNKVLAMRRIHDAYQATSGLGDWLREVPADKADGSSKDEMLRVIDDGGNVHHYQVMDKLLYDALINGTTNADGKMWDAIGALTGVFKQLTTMSNPFFALSNAMRDYTEAYTKGSNANPVTFAAQWVKAIVQLTAAQAGKSSAMVDAYYAAGGGDSSIAPRGMRGVQNMERTLYSKYFSDSLRRMVAGSNFKERARGGADALHATGARLKEGINAFNNVIEGSQRLAEFSRTYRKTGDADAAMYASTNVTTDFRRAGNWDGMNKAGKVFAFMNAGIQGTYSWYRMAKEARFDQKAFVSKGIRAAVMFAMAPIAQSLLMAALGDEDKEAYDAMAENVKADNILIPKSLTGGDVGTFFKIPKPKGPLAAVGDAMGRALIEAMQKEGSWEAFVAYGMSDWTSQSMESLIEAVNPYGSPIFAPALQIMMNQTWYGSPIESKWMRDQNIAPTNRIKDTTSSVAIFLANLPGLKNKVSPVQMDYFLNQTLGVAGDYITGDAGNALIDKVAGKQNAYRAGSSTASFIRTRLNTDPTAASDVTSSMYDADTLLQGIVADAKQTGQDQNPYARLNAGLTEAEQKRAVTEAKNMTKKGGVLYKAKQKTSQRYKDIDAVQGGSSLTDDAKVLRVREIKWKMILENAVAVKAAEDYIRKYITGTPALHKKFYG